MKLVAGAQYKSVDFSYEIRRSPQPELGSTFVARFVGENLNFFAPDPTDVVGTAGGVFFFAALMFNFVIQVLIIFSISCPLTYE